MCVQDRLISELEEDVDTTHSRLKATQRKMAVSEA
jgi:hypothetical protein